MDVINDQVLLYLIKHRHIENYLRIFEVHKDTHIGFQAFEHAVNLILVGQCIQRMLLSLLDPYQELDIHANDDRLPQIRV
jgi:hypothetical protein